LQNENKELQQRIVAATESINTAVKNLQDISDDATNNQNTENVTKLFAQVEASIEDINKAIQGSPTQGPPTQGPPTQGPPTQGQSQSIPSSEPIIGVNGVPQGYTFGDLLNQLQTKSRQQNGRSKYSDALTQIKTTNNINDIPKILNSSNIEFKNNSIMGGKKHKTKKHRKQKGGFSYKLNSKRKGLSTPSYMYKTMGKGKRTSIKKSI